MRNRRRWRPAHTYQTPATAVAAVCLKGQRGPSCRSGPTPQRTVPYHTAAQRTPRSPARRRQTGCAAGARLRGGGADTSVSHFSRQPARTNREATRHTAVGTAQQLGQEGAPAPGDKPAAGTCPSPAAGCGWGQQQLLCSPQHQLGQAGPICSVDII